MVFEEERKLISQGQQISEFIRGFIKSSDRDVSEPERWRVLDAFCRQHDIDPDTARGINSLMTKSPWANKTKDLEEALFFALWLKEHVQPDFYGRRHMVYLADAGTPLDKIFNNMRANHQYWIRIFGKKLFATGDSPSWRGQVLKSSLSLPDYYISVKGQSGSGTFAIDLAIGYDPRHVHQSTRGEMWRVGVDIELSPTGERILRIVRTGSGQKSHGNPEQLKEQKVTRDKFLDEYKISPQRLLHFLALQLGHDLGFDKVKGLSTQGAEELSLLHASKSPIDYTASLLDVGFTYREGNWHEIQDLRNRFYSDIFAAHWHEKESSRYDVDAYTEVIRGFNTMTDEDGNQISLKLSSNPLDLEKAWSAYADIHHQILERKRGQRLGRRENGVK